MTTKDKMASASPAARVGLLVAIALLLSAATLSAAALPELPRIYVDTTYSPPGGNTITVNAGGNFQTALNTAQPGDTIVLEAGATFTGPFTLPNKTSGSGWIYVLSSSAASLPTPGNRVGPPDAANMPKLVVTAASGGSTLTAAAGAHHYRFVGIEFKPVAGNFVFNLIDVGNGMTALSDVPHHVVFDRVYVHGDPTVGSRRGIAMNGATMAVIDSYVSDFKEAGADSQAVWTYNSPGPLKVVNNYLEGAGENFMTGGSDPAITDLVPSDIEIRGNYFFKPLSWMGMTWDVKNLFELKNSQRVLIEGNRFENNWADAQSGFAVLLTPRNQNGGAPWCVVQDVTFRLNTLVNLGSGFNMSGEDDNNPSQVTRRVLIQNNVIDGVNGLGGADGRLFQMLHGIGDLTIDHNTGFVVTAFGMTESTPPVDAFDLKNNLVQRGTYGFIGTGTGEGNPTLAAWYVPNWQFTKTAVIGAPSGSYPPGNYFPADIPAVGFVDYAGKDFHLAASSPYKGLGTDGKDLGADIDALNAATSCAISGLCAGSTGSAALSVDPTAGGSGNGVLEIGEIAAIQPSWANTGAVGFSLTGVASNLTGPGGLTYGIPDATADYGVIAAGQTKACFDCYLIQIGGARPVQHLDVMLDETITPGVAPPDAVLKTWTLHVGGSFSDVAATDTFYPSIETIFHFGVTAGCGGGTTYCPFAANLRQEMAVFLLKAILGSGYVPPAPGPTPVFVDVTSGIYRPWIEDLYGRGITGGCQLAGDPLAFCPDRDILRQEMAVFLLKTLLGSGYVPPAPGPTPVFTDVPGGIYRPWIEDLYGRGITGGCQLAGDPLAFCPDAAVTRQQMAAFITRTFGLLLYGP